MRAVTASVLVLAFAGTAVSEQAVREISWTRLKESGQLKAGRVQTDGWLRIGGKAGEPTTIRVVEISGPGLTGWRYALRGSIRHQNVAEGSYLEMWSTFGDGSRCFTRTMAGSGLLKELEGDSPARPFALPFIGSEQTGPPVRLELNLVLARGGTVWLSPLRLVQYAPGEDPMRLPGAWWSDRAGGWIGAIGGSVVGLLGALVGLLAGLARARRLVLLLSRVLFVCGWAGLAAGSVAVLLGQPYAVCYPLLLLGLILTVVIGFSFRGIRRRYEQAELRRIEAMDIGSAGAADRARS